MNNCGICGKELDQPNNVASMDCGGDCLQCLAEDYHDPDCVKAMRKAYPNWKKPALP